MPGMTDQLRQLPRPLFYLFAGTTMTRMGSFVFPYLTIYLSEARGYAVDRIGQILSVGSIGLLLGNFAGGWLADRWSRKWTLVSALLLNAVGFAALSAGYETPVLYALALFIGYFGSGMYTPAANTTVADLAPEPIRPFAYTVNYVCINIGMALGPLMAGFLAAASYSWLFIGDVASTIACAVLITFGLSETRAPTRTPVEGVVKKRVLLVWLRHPFVLVFCLSYVFLIGPLMGLEYAVPLLVKNVFLSKLVFVGVIYTINATCILALSFPIERLLRGRNEMWMMVLAGLFWTAGLAILAVGFSVFALMLCTLVWTVGEIIASIVVPSFIARSVAPDVKGRFMALNDIVRSFAGMVSPIGLGLLWEARGASSVVNLLVGVPAIGVLCYLALLLYSARRARAGASVVVAIEP